MATPEQVRTAIQAVGSASLSQSQVTALANGLADARNQLPENSELSTAISTAVSENTTVPGLSQSFSEASGTSGTGAPSGQQQPVQQTAQLTQDQEAPPAEDTAAVGGTGATAGGTSATESGTTGTQSSGSAGATTSTPTGSTSSGGGGSTTAQSPTN